MKRVSQSTESSSGRGEASNTVDQQDAPLCPVENHVMSTSVNHQYIEKVLRLLTDVSLCYNGA